MINFLKYRYFSYTLFVFVAVAFASLLWYRGFNYSVDFTGGTQVILRFDKPVTTDKVRTTLKEKGFKSVEVSEFGAQEMRVRIQDVSVEAIGLGQKIKDVLEQSVPETQVLILQSETVSPSIGKSLVWNALKAILISLLAMLLYIFARFTFSFAIGSIASIVHDVLIICTIFLALNWEVSVDVIAAILMIIGYSLNDTIVIFSRIREHLARPHHNEALESIVNEAINSTLRRTLLTSIATALVVLALLVLGGESLRNLSLALLIGIVFGTYSSIFIASPIMLILYRGSKEQKTREATTTIS